MITRFVMLKLNPEYATAEGRAAFVDHSREVLPTVPGVTGVTLGVPADADCESKWDIGLLVHFDRVEDIEPYRVHPVHRAYVEEYMAPRVECRKVWNFREG